MKILKRVLLILNICFIFYMSLLNADASNEVSNGFSHYVFTFLNLDIDFTLFLNKYIGIIREAAHFIEFFSLGILMYLNIDHPKRLAIANLSNFMIAIIDECIQLFSDGRTFQIVDLALDDLGSITGIVLIHLILKIYDKRNNA